MQQINPFEISGNSDIESKSFNFSLTSSGTDGDLLCKMWAKQVIGKMEKDLVKISPRHSKNAIARITKISESYGVLCRYTNFVAINEQDLKFKQFPAAVPIEVAEPRNFARMHAADLSMLTISSASAIKPRARMKSKARPLSISYDSFDDFEDSVCCEETAYNPQSISPQEMLRHYTGFTETNLGNEEKNLDWTVLSLHKHMYTLGAGLDNFCKEKLRDIMFSIQTEAIDYENEFFRLDWILSKAWGQWNDEDWFNLRAKLLNGLKCANLKKYSTAEIASEQNIGGSFGHLEYLQKHLTLLALSRMINDDPYLYGRQIKKVLTWADNTDWTEYLEEKRSLDKLSTLLR